MGQKNSLQENLSLEKYKENKDQIGYLTNVYAAYKARIPYLIEDYLGVDMSYQKAKNVPNNLITIIER